MTCRVCTHWKDQQEAKKGPSEGVCALTPQPVKTLSNYRCGSCLVNPDDARYWLLNHRYDDAKIRELNVEIRKLKATLERVRARNRKLKLKPS